MELYSNYPANDFRYLAHHGVKGMRWGHRKQIDRKRRVIGGAIAGGLIGAGSSFAFQPMKEVKTPLPSFIEPFQVDAFGGGTFIPKRYTRSKPSIGRVAVNTAIGAAAGAISAATIGSLKYRKETSNGKTILNSLLNSPYVAPTHKDTAEYWRNQGAHTLIPTETQRKEQERRLPTRRY